MAGVAQYLAILSRLHGGMEILAVWAYQPQHAALVAEVYRQYPHSRLLAKAAVLIEKAGGQQ